MPINATAGYYLAEKKYLEARTREERIVALGEMIRELPKHKGTENLLAQLKKRLARLKSEASKKVGKKEKSGLKKEYPIVALVGHAQSGKSSLLNALTNAKAEVSSVPYTTKEIRFGIMRCGDALVQLVEVPSIFDGRFNTVLQMSDLIVVLLSENSDEQKDFFRKLAKNKKILFVVSKDDENRFGGVSVFNSNSIEGLRSRIWQGLDVIQVCTKSPGREKQTPAVILPIGSKVYDLASKIHKDFIKNFKFARVFNDRRFSGRKVGLDYILENGDTVEFHV